MEFPWFLLGGVVVLLLVWLKKRFADFQSQSMEDYADMAPIFDLKQHLNGKMVCEGMIYGPLGRITSSFSADFDMQWDGDVGVMKEHFRYNDGSEQHREWTITLKSGGKFTAEAPDVVGKGSGAMSGMSIRMFYNIRLPEEAGGHVLDTVDWMYLTPDGTIINRSQFRKFGFRVAELIATIRRVEGVAEAKAA
ncbi:MAG: DUF3833 family protein [Pseudomonadota bacterium]